MVDPKDCRTKIIDFGLSTIVKTEEQIRSLRVFKGTPLYSPLEKLVEMEYDGRRADTWSVGVTLFKISTGKFPFGEDATSFGELVMSVESDGIVYPDKYPLLLKDLVQNMLSKNQILRYTIYDCIQHPWFRTPIRMKKRSSSSYISFKKNFHQ